MAVGAELVGWFRQVARELPWRREPRDPYHVLVSELMLQQTQVDRVAPRFEAFVARFPSIAELARATEEDVVEAWSGLGYYRRARFLHGAARVVADDGGELPSTVEELRGLPGVGPYTAAAVASLAFGVPEPVLDGNVLRVGCRVLALDTYPRSAQTGRKVRSWVRSLMDEGLPPGVVNEALMELGATLCLPRGPRCDGCPMAADCEARRGGRQESIPAPRKGRALETIEWVAACCIEPSTGHWLLRRIDEGPVLEGLWLPPLVQAPAPGRDVVATARGALPFRARGGVALPTVRHSITYRRITVSPVIIDGSARPRLEESWAWAAPDAPGLPTSSLLGKLARIVEASRPQGRLFDEED